MIAPGPTRMTIAAHRARDRVRHETAGADLKAGGIGVWPLGAWGRRPPARPTPRDQRRPQPQPQPRKPFILSNNTKAKPANANEATTGFGVESTDLDVVNPKRIGFARACEPFREAIGLDLSQGRNAAAIWQDLVAGGRFSRERIEFKFQLATFNINFHFLASLSKNALASLNR
jgi:hypothetical protein